MKDKQTDSGKLRFRHLPLSRRRVLATTALGFAGAGAAMLVGCGNDDADAPDFDGDLEVTSLRISKPPPVCVAAQYIAEQYLYDEGFQRIEYVPQPTIAEIAPRTSDGTVDFAMHFAAPVVVAIDRSANLAVLAGIHVGCFELFATEEVRDVRDLVGRRVAVTGLGADSGDYNFIAGIFQFVGIDIEQDVTFVEGSPLESIDRLKNGEVDAFLAFPPFTQQLRAEGTGHVVLSSIEDDPWAQYFCCLVTGNKDFIANYPAATKRVVRAYIKAAEHCARRPEDVADFLVARGYISNRDYAGQMMRALPYDVWDRFDPDDTLRFYALQLHDAGVISSTPEEIIERGTDWRFLNQLKQELAYAPGPNQGRYSFYCDPATGLPLGPGRVARAFGAQPGARPGREG
jgi:NitT/TauT family transport system substrate-binding protein